MFHIWFSEYILEENRLATSYLMMTAQVGHDGYGAMVGRPVVGQHIWAWRAREATNTAQPGSKVALR